MEDPDNEMRHKLMELVSRRDELEEKILRAFDELRKLNIGMDEPLVDSEGYPRNDVDICAVRTLRNLIICTRNDCKDLTNQIEEGLHHLHQTSNQEGNEEQLLMRGVPFAKVEIVDIQSPAEKANLLPGDLLTKFATVTHSNFQNLGKLATIVGENVGQPIRVNVLRNNIVVPLILTPERWEGPGYLGCKIVPIK